MSHRLLLLIMCIICSGCATAPANNDPWFNRDKFYHFGASALAAGITTAAADANAFSGSETWQAALGVTLILGVGKETYDVEMKQNAWSWKDLFWDLLGGLAGYGIVEASN